MTTAIAETTAICECRNLDVAFGPNQSGENEIFFFWIWKVLLDDVAGGEEDSKEEASELVWFGPDQSGEDEFSS